MVEVKGGDLDGPGFTRGEGLGELEPGVAEGAAERALNAPGGMIDKSHLCVNICGSDIRQRQYGPDKGIGYTDSPFVCDIDIIPDAYVTAADRRDPVPADGRVHRGVVGAHDAAVLVGTVRRLLLNGSVVDILMDEDGQVVPAFLQDAGHVELSLAESPLDTAERDSVQVYIRLPIYAVEMQELALGVQVCIKSVAVPERGTEIRVRAKELVVGKCRIGNGAGIDEACEYGAGHRGRHPGTVVIRRAREGRAVGLHQGGAPELPGSACKVLARATARRRGLRHGGCAAAPVHLELGELERPPVRRGGERRPDIARPGGLGEFHFAKVRGAADPCHRCPDYIVMGCQYLPGSRRVQPMENQLIELRLETQVHRNPLVSRSGAPPGADEPSTRQDIEQLPVHIEIDRIERQCVGSFDIEIHPENRILYRLFQINGTGELPSPGHWIPTQFLPACPIFRSVNRYLSPYAAGTHYLYPVCLHGHSVENDLNGRIRHSELDPGVRFSVEKPLVKFPFHLSALRPGVIVDIDIRCRLSPDDAVGNQLGGQVVVIAG